MAYKAAFSTEKYKIVIQKSLLPICLILDCYINTGCPIERIIKDNIVQEHGIILTNYYGHSVFILVSGFTGGFIRSDVSDERIGGKFLSARVAMRQGPSPRGFKAVNHEGHLHCRINNDDARGAVWLTKPQFILKNAKL